MNKYNIPDKCYCGCSNLEVTNEYYDTDWHNVIEYTLTCSECGLNIGTYSYSCWEGNDEDGIPFWVKEDVSHDC